HRRGAGGDADGPGERRHHRKECLRRRDRHPVRRAPHRHGTRRGPARYAQDHEGAFPAPDRRVPRHGDRGDARPGRPAGADHVRADAGEEPVARAWQLDRGRFAWSDRAGPSAGASLTGATGHVHDVVAVGPVGAGTLGQRLRLYSGLVLFVFVATHLINHALGLVSIDAMDAFRSVRSGAWRSLSGTILLYGALVLHIALALAKFVRRRTWRMNFWETVQLVFGLAIPLFLFRHILGIRLPHELYGVDDNYTYALWVMWPAEAWNQLFLITVVWVHACIGLHFWLRLKRWYGDRKSVV